LLYGRFYSTKGFGIPTPFKTMQDSMNSKLAAYIRSEQPRIDATLNALTAQLPSPVRPVAEHILHAGGKRLRPLLTVLTASLLGYRADDILPLAAAMEMVHMATLLHDDVIDKADSRRAQPAAHRKFGATRAILAGDALLAKANRIMAGYGDPRLLSCLAAALEETAAGQILELDLQAAVPFDNTHGLALDLDYYFAVVQGKTAWMLRACCELGALRAGADEAALEDAALYGLSIGMAFQIVDDALDFAPAGTTGKPEGGDVREGKLTPPLAFYMESLPATERPAFVRDFLGRELDAADVARIAAAVRAGGFDRAARNMADLYLGTARVALDRLTAGRPDGRADGPERALLEAVIRYVRDREH
jgi:octaprenyl-diphosphate synthase